MVQKYRDNVAGNGNQKYLTKKPPLITDSTINDSSVRTHELVVVRGGPIRQLTNSLRSLYRLESKVLQKKSNILHLLFELILHFAKSVFNFNYRSGHFLKLKQHQPMLTSSTSSQSLIPTLIFSLYHSLKYITLSFFLCITITHCLSH